MATNRFLQTMNIQPAINIQTAAAARSGDWVSLENYASVVIVAHAEVGAAADDVAVTVRQATSNSGGSAKGLTPRRGWRKQGATLDVGGAYDHVTPGTFDSVNHAIGMEGENINMVLIEVGADELDVAGGFSFLQVQTSAGAAAKILTAFYILLGPRYAVAVDEWPAVNA